MCASVSRTVDNKDVSWSFESLQALRGEVMHEYKAKMLRIVDGDTVDVDIDLGFGVWLKKQRIRLYGIDTQKVVQEI